MSKDRESLQAPAGAAVTTEPPAQLAMLKRAAIARSMTNPRTHFDDAYIKDLATSIQAHGILQPILVRPLPGARVPDTDPGVTHEIICGECRWRASEIAGVEDLPVLIRVLTDLQVLQVQLVENLKRKDLHPLEEAEGFERLMKDHGLTVEDIAAKVDKSASQIYVTLKLLELTPECREQLYAGKLTRSTALLVARAPAYLQTQIARDIMRPTGADDEPMSYRQALRHIQQHYMLQLAHAVFDIKDASLVPKAGSCGTCAKNTGANADMFEDVKGGDTCTDPKCFDAKKVAHYAAVTKAAEAKGQTVIQGKEAKELIAYEGATPKGYQLLDHKEYINGNFTSLRKLAGKDGPTPVLIVDPFTKLPVEALPIEVASKVIKQAGAERANNEPRKADLEEEFKDAWQARAIEQLHAALMAGKSSGITVAVARHIAAYYEQSLTVEGGERFARLFNVPSAKVGTSNAIADFLKTCPDAMVGPALMVLMVEDDLSTYNSHFELAGLIATDAGVDFKDVQAQVKTDMLEAAAAKRPTPKVKAKAKTKNTTAAEAQAGISEALQAVPTEIKIGQRVRFKDGLKGPNGKTRKVCGREGYVDRIQEDSEPPSYGVRYGNKGSDYANARFDELIIVPGTAADGPIKVKPPKAAKNTKLARDDDAAPFNANGKTIDPAAAWPFPTSPRA